MKSLISYLVLSIAALASADTTISVLGVGVFPVSNGGAPCSGSDQSILGTCPSAQSGLAFGSCCVAIPNRMNVVMGCAPLESATDSCDLVAARLHDKLSTSSVPSTSVPNVPVAPSDTPSVTQINALLPLSPSVEPSLPPVTELPGYTTSPTTELPTTTPVETTASPSTEPTPSTTPKENFDANVQQAPMTDQQGTSALKETTTSNANSILVGVSIVGVAVAIIGGVLFVRKQKPLENSGTPSTPPQPASMGGPVAYSQETPCHDDDFLTPKEDLVCL